jgi:hypothetical protein
MQIKGRSRARPLRLEARRARRACQPAYGRFPCGDRPADHGEKARLRGQASRAAPGASTPGAACKSPHQARRRPRPWPGPPAFPDTSSAGAHARRRSRPRQPAGEPFRSSVKENPAATVSSACAVPDACRITLLGVSSPSTRRGEALVLARDLLDDIELNRITPMDVARKTARLARLLDDAEAMRWLRYEVSGYPPGSLDSEATAAAYRSNRLATLYEDQATYWTQPLGQVEVQMTAALTELEASGAAAASSSQMAIVVEREKRERMNALQTSAAQNRRLIDAVIGSMHDYVQQREVELRFGSAVETAFEVVRDEVDAAIGNLVPAALTMLAGAFENASSENPEHWANAASTCRRLLKEVADAVRPPGDDVVKADGKRIRMTSSHYINRLIDWVEQNQTSETQAAMTVAELESLRTRLEAVDNAGQKGAHAAVTRLDASRFITGTYLVLGDILRGYVPPALEAPAPGTLVEQPDLQQGQPAGNQSPD